MVQQMAIYNQGCKLMVSVLHVHIQKVILTYRQDAGQNIFHFRRQMPDTSFG